MRENTEQPAVESIQVAEAPKEHRYEEMIIETVSEVANEIVTEADLEINAEPATLSL